MVYWAKADVRLKPYSSLTLSPELFNLHEHANVSECRSGKDLSGAISL